MAEFRTLSILIACYNEEATLVQVLDRIGTVHLMNGISKEIVIVDDCSTDKSAEIIKSYKESHPEVVIQFAQHDLNRGKGAALHTAIGLATGEYVVIQDADLEYDPTEYDRLLAPAIKADADVVYGSRFKGSSPHRILFFWHTIGNQFLTFLSNMTTNLNLTDMETCYKLFRTEIIQGLRLEEQRFGFEPEVTAKVARIRGVRIYEVGISYYGRTYEEGKKIGWKDGVRALYCIIKYGVFYS